MNDELVLNAKKVSHQLLRQAVFGSGRISWTIPKYDAQRNLLRKQDYSLMSGSCGIIYFLAELYLVTRARELWTTIEKSIEGLENILDEEPSHDYSLYSGKMGVAFLYIRLFEITEEQKYLTRAIKLGKEAMPFLEDDLTNNCLYEGRAGVILILAVLHKLTPDEEILNCLQRGLSKVLWEANYFKSGLSWYYNQTQTGEVLGWGYGSAGIAFVLETIGRSFNSEYLMRAASHAHLLIDKNWNRQIKNWPNHHFCVDSPAEDKKILKAFKNKKELKKILLGKDTLDFSNGLMGIMFARFKHQTNNKQQINSMFKKLAKATNLVFESPEDASSYNMIKRYYSHDHNMKSDQNGRVSSKMVRLRLGNKSPGLCHGLAGWGHHYLMAADEIKNPYFCLDFSCLKNDRKVTLVNINDLKIQPFVKYFPRTLSLIPEKKRALVEKFTLMKASMNLPKAINAVLGDKKTIGATLRDAYKLERAKYLLMDRREHPSISYYISQYNCFLLNRELQKRSIKKLLKTKFYLNPSVQLIATETDLSRDLRAENAAHRFPEERSYILLMASDQKESVKETFLSGFDELLLTMTRPTTPNELLQYLKPHLDVKGGQLTIERRLEDFILRKVQEGILELSGK